MTEKTYLNDPYPKVVDSILSNTPDHGIPMQSPPDDAAEQYIFPSNINDLPNEDISTWSLKLSGWYGYALTLLGRLDIKRRFLRHKYEYLYNQHHSEQLFKALEKTNHYPLGDLKTRNTRLYEVLEIKSKELAKNVPEVLAVNTELLQAEQEYAYLERRANALKVQVEAIAREMSFKQSELRIFGKS